jgi:murein L,D-transpeptidase YcbB/YkuD
MVFQRERSLPVHWWGFLRAIFLTMLQLHYNKILITLFCLLPALSSTQAQTIALSNAFTKDNQKLNLNYPSLVAKFYELRQNKMIWFLPVESAQQLRQALKDKIDSSINIGLNREKFHPREIDKNVDDNFLEEDSVIALDADRFFTDAAISYCKYIYQGVGAGQWMMYDEISPKQEALDNDFLLQQLANVSTSDGLDSFLNSLEPAGEEYNMLRSQLLLKSDSLTAFQKKQLTTSLAFCRWLHHFKFEQWIVVNIASATLRYYEYDSLKLSMKVVVGKASTKTPRFAAHLNEVILYPYWNVPTSIALNELLPLFKRDPSNVDYLNMQIIDASGNVINHHKLQWKNYSKSYFPFHIRQSTGCDNSLGVIKFNLTSPYSVYLHDTNYKGAFILSSRYLSHGCIRLEKPVELANYLLPVQVNSEYLESCLKEQQPVTLNVSSPVPVFVIYQPVEVDRQNKARYFKDVYGLLK